MAQFDETLYDYVGKKGYKRIVVSKNNKYLIDRKGKIIGIDSYMLEYKVIIPDANFEEKEKINLNKPRKS